jgi:hypothetical protein
VFSGAFWGFMTEVVPFFTLWQGFAEAAAEALPKGLLTWLFLPHEGTPN